MTAVPGCAEQRGSLRSHVWLATLIALAGCWSDHTASHGALRDAGSRMESTGTARVRAQPPTVAAVTPDTDTGAVDAGLSPNLAASGSPRAVDFDGLGARCEHDRRGNWVCVFRAGQETSAGPCAFGADATVALANHVTWSPDSAGSVVARYTALGERTWTRRWDDGSPFGLVVGDDGAITWAGEHCVRASTQPKAEGNGYYGSCRDAYVATLGIDGELLWDWSFGTDGGLERVSDLAVAPGGGLYLGGLFDAPLELPDHPALASRGGGDFFVLQLDREHRVDWANTWGSSSDDGNDVRLATPPSGGLVVSGHTGLSPAPPGGFVARLNADGSSRWEASPAIYISDVAIGARDQIYVQLSDGALARVDGQDVVPLPTPLGLGIARLQATVQGTLIVASQNGDRILELDDAGRVLRELSFRGPETFWYEGGLCVAPNGTVAVSSTIAQDSSFGILDEPMTITEKSAFLLVLSSW